MVAVDRSWVGEGDEAPRVGEDRKCEGVPRGQSERLSAGVEHIEGQRE